MTRIVLDTALKGRNQSEAEETRIAVAWPRFEMGRALTSPLKTRKLTGNRIPVHAHCKGDPSCRIRKPLRKASTFTKMFP